MFSTCFGLLIGSFLNVVIHRLPLDQSVVKPRSSCPKCGHMIRWYENIPVISYLFLKGKCSNCSVKIPIRYPLIELVTGIIAFSLAPNTLELNDLINFLFYFSIASSFLAHLVIDIEHQLLPDKINIYLVLIILPFAILNLPPMHWLLGGLIGFFSTYGVTYIFYKLRGQIGLGGGDIKLFGILGILLGPIGVLNNIFMSCMLGSVIGVILIASKKLDRNTPFAFGPFIIIVASIQIFFPKIFELINPL
jgi:leader peptidase (prepilin peptidase)/N-methyltransferase